ncbi:hypothetical protein MPSEU_000213700 [Mayamaea pseudoterrestris]|nr:hypothetical protein MPSEU_000213700 [Mayamaea pseudoterrestris]
MAKICKKSSSSKPSRKRPSPFRIKVGSVVALRMQSTGNSISICSERNSTLQAIKFLNYSYVWAAPVPGRDEGLALLGKCVRLFLPKKAVPDPSRRVLEGQVVGVHHLKPNKIHLLVDQATADAFPFITKVPESLSVSAPDASRSKSARKHAALEERIRGANKVLLQIKLSAPGPAFKIKSDQAKSIQWAVLKLVPNKLFRESTDSAADPRASLNNDTSSITASKQSILHKQLKASVKHVGDGRDSTEQQVNNWRWLTSRYHDSLFRNVCWTIPPMPLNGKNDMTTLCSNDITIYSQILSAGFIGVVKQINVVGASTGSLASVTIERLILPQHTAAMTKQNVQLVYKDYDHHNLLLHVPIEQLVVIANSLELQATVTMEDSLQSSPPDDPHMLNRMLCSHAYSLQHDTYFPFNIETPKEAPIKHPCHRCRRVSNDPIECKSSICPLLGPHGQCTRAWCNTCLMELEQQEATSERFPCCHLRCDCHRCMSFLGSTLQDDLFAAVAAASKKNAVKIPKLNESTLLFPLATVNTIDNVDFNLPRFLLDSVDHPIPRAQSSRTKPSSSRRIMRIYDKAIRKPKAMSKSSKRQSNEKRKVLIVEDYTCFKPTCARHVGFDDASQLCKHINQSQLNPSSVCVYSDRSRNMREVLKEQRREFPSEKEDKPNTGNRAARANQRRFMKNVSLLGSSALTVDTLATREPQIRFDRSSIHAWGVFADEDIAAEEMIIEYKGVLISNTVAEKREKLYEVEKIGSDYMFRIDSHSVCDATKEGNVARFINASCDPNCYTKIITIDGTKRIVIYSKRAVVAGEELAYDYKFPLEYDPSKRISCHCGAKDCRGYMNWDKKFVVVPDEEKLVADDDGNAKADHCFDDISPADASRPGDDDSVSEMASFASDGCTFTDKNETNGALISGSPVSASVTTMASEKVVGEDGVESYKDKGNALLTPVEISRIKRTQDDSEEFTNNMKVILPSLSAASTQSKELANYAPSCKRLKMVVEAPRPDRG